MNTWRPASGIRFKALGLHWRGNRLLASEVYEDSGRLKGVRPLGGTVEFGETAQAAVIREFQEELGITVKIVGSPTFIENIYVHEGSLGHEMLAIFDVTFPPEAFAGQTRIAFREDSGVECFAEWFALEELDGPGQPQLYPTGLKALLKSKR
ncbi:NUDIX hydrolase [Rhodovulum sulfidophilum]|uniref:NUDIX hydrolase n=1 Tax=Rhodovulum sulfidophilum TaxID=35806 RepID=UPI000952570C|nr:NUDIX domain-containing protein [Rhodovulum sulfidophilum]MBL3554413.1 NUDIX domain-containing protein [Rhodovulum sulfidophilum]OLS48905.1 DNA mismatch repair protein MutT [Rhodovulum sulfidophilum]